MAHQYDPVTEGVLAGSAVSPGQLTYFDDLMAVREFLFQSLLQPKDYEFQRQKTVYTRPSYLIQSLSQALVPKTGYSLEVDHNMLVEFYALNYVEGMQVAGDLLLLLGAGNGLGAQLDPSRRSNGLVLPYWDLTDPDNPVLQTDEWWSQNRGFDAGSVPRVGARVVQDTVVVNCEQEESEVLEVQEWTVSCTFRLLAPRVLYDYTLETPLTEVKLTGVLSG